MPSDFTTNLRLEQPGTGEQAGVWGDIVNDNMSRIDRNLALCAEDAANHVGLDFAYHPGRVWDGSALTLVPGGTVSLADDDTNYVEVDPADGSVSANVVGFTAGLLPLFEVDTAAGVIDEVRPRQVFLAAAGSGGGGDGNGDVRGWVPGDLFVKTGAGRVMVTRGGTITKVLVRVASAPTGANLILDLHLNGTSIWDANQGNRVTILANETSANQTVFDTDAVAEGDELRLDVDQVGSTLPGSELTWGVLITPA